MLVGRKQIEDAEEKRKRQIDLGRRKCAVAWREIDPVRVISEVKKLGSAFLTSGKIGGEIEPKKIIVDGIPFTVRPGFHSEWEGPTERHPGSSVFRGNYPSVRIDEADPDTERAWLGGLFDRERAEKEYCDVFRKKDFRGVRPIHILDYLPERDTFDHQYGLAVPND